MNTRRPDPWARALRSERLRLGMTLEEFAVQVGYPPNRHNMSSIEAGRRATGARARSRIEAALGKRLVTLTDEERRRWIVETERQMHDLAAERTREIAVRRQ